MKNSNLEKLAKLELAKTDSVELAKTDSVELAKTDSVELPESDIVSLEENVTPEKMVKNPWISIPKKWNTYNGIPLGYAIQTGLMLPYSDNFYSVINGVKTLLKCKSLEHGIPLYHVDSQILGGRYFFRTYYESKGVVTIDIFRDGEIFHSHMQWKSTSLYLCAKLGITYKGNEPSFHKWYEKGRSGRLPSTSQNLGIVTEDND
jgi:hypothetical protein